MNTEQPNTIDCAVIKTSVGVKSFSALFHRALLHPQMVKKNNKFILQFYCKKPRYAIVKI